MLFRNHRVLLIFLLLGLQCGFAAAQVPDEKIAFYVSLNLKGERAERWWPRILEASVPAGLLGTEPGELQSIFEPRLSLMAEPSGGVIRVGLKQPERVEQAVKNQAFSQVVDRAEVRERTLILHLGEPLDSGLWEKQPLRKWLSDDHELAVFVDPGNFTSILPEEIVEVFEKEEEGRLLAQLEQLNSLPPMMVAVTGERLEAWLDSEAVEVADAAWSFDGAWLDKNSWSRLNEWREIRDEAFEALAGLNMSLPLHMKLWLSVTEPIDRLPTSPSWGPRPDGPLFARRVNEGDGLSLAHRLLADAFRNRRPYTGPFEETLDISEDGVWHYTLDSAGTALVEKELAVEWEEVPAKPAPPAEACRENLTNVGTALEMYSVDFGAYPQSLEPLTPNYLRTVPICPSADGKDYFYQRNSSDYQLLCPEHR